MKSKAGRAFMVLFNTWYYSFSPPLSTFISNHPTDRSILRTGMYPLVAVLYTSYYVYALVSPLGLEEATIMSGIVAASLLGLFYLAPIVLIANRLLRRHAKHLSLRPKDASIWAGASIVMLGVAYIFGSQALGVATANLVLSMLTLAGLTGPATLTSTSQRIARTTLKWFLMVGGSNRAYFGPNVARSQIQALTHN
jgi:hypothetical protein